MVFNENVTKDQIEEFENETLNKISNSDVFICIKKELAKRNIRFNIGVQHTENNLKKYSSHIIIDIVDSNGNVIFEVDEPNCCLMLCEPLCFVRAGHLVGIDFPDEEMFSSLAILLNQIKKIVPKY